MIMCKTKNLREGFSTGSAATAAGMSALHLLLGGEHLSFVDIPLPPEDGRLVKPELRIPIHSTSVILKDEAIGIVQKDGGDDPDVTHKAFIHALIKLNDKGKINIDGGSGVGRFTLPGLPLPVGYAAINPAPRKQIKAGLELVAKNFGYSGGIDVCIEVPNGEKIAKNTFNPRLGIKGGISILGTQGTVKPFSHAAWKATIAQGLQVAAANNCKSVCLSTGRRSERLLLSKYEHLPKLSAVQVADFAEFSLQEAAKYKFEQIIWGCFFGKLVKLAQGHAYTHAHAATIDFNLLSLWCAEFGLNAQNVHKVKQCVTANHALEIILQDSQHIYILESIAMHAAKTASNFAGQNVQINLFHLDGRVLISL